MPAPVIVALTDDLLRDAASHLLRKWETEGRVLFDPDWRGPLAADPGEALQAAALDNSQSPPPQPDLFG